MKLMFYVATRLEAAERAKRVASLLGSLGDELSYDWTTHGSVQNEGVERIAEVASGEKDGVAMADYVVVLLPGGRGTHVELGIALGTGKSVFVHAAQAAHLGQDGRTCAFGHARSTTTRSSPWSKAMTRTCSLPWPAGAERAIARSPAPFTADSTARRPHGPDRIRVRPAVASICFRGTGRRSLSRAGAGGKVRSRIHTWPGWDSEHAACSS